MAKIYKVWIAIDEYDDETDEVIERDDLSFVLPFSGSATCLTEWDAVRVAQEMHAAVNPQFEVDQEVIEKVRHAARARQEKSTGFAPVGGEDMTHTATHTPGPRIVEPRQWDHGASLAIVAPHNGYIVAVVPFDGDIQVVDEPDGDTVRRHPDELPNAAMLAAAPAMYALIQDMREAFYVKGARKALLAVMERSKEILAQADGK